MKNYTVTFDVSVTANSAAEAARYALDDLRDTSLGSWSASVHDDSTDTDTDETTQEPARIELRDDGTLDTVLRCNECGEEFRDNFDTCDDVDGPASYDAFVAEFMEEVEAEHVCNACMTCGTVMTNTSEGLYCPVCDSKGEAWARAIDAENEEASND